MTKNKSTGGVVLFDKRCGVVIPRTLSDLAVLSPAVPITMDGREYSPEANVRLLWYDSCRIRGTASLKIAVYVAGP